MGNKLLLADDSITIQKVVGIIFSNEDYELTIVDNGNSALEKARENKPDVMLVDALMPGLNGYDVCSEIRRDPALRGTPILLLTGAFEPFDEGRATQCGADDFISKPFESQQLIDKVKALIDLAQSRSFAEPLPVTAQAAAVAPTMAAAVDWAIPDEDLVPEPAEDADGFDFAADFLAADEAPAAQAFQAAPAFMDDVVEASPEDDLWGAFEIEDEMDGQAVEFGEVVELADGGGEFAEDVIEAAPFAMTEGEMELLDGAGAASASVGEEPPFTMPVADESEDSFVFEEEPGVGENPEFADEPSFSVETAVTDFGEDELQPEPEEDFIFESEETLSTPFSAEFEMPPVAAEEAAPLIAPEPVPAPVEEFPTAAVVAGAAAAVTAGVAAMIASPKSPVEAEFSSAAPAAEPAPLTLSEDQLAQAVSRISREIIERIVWEVVPDLAEALIKEEIRKIREGK